MINIPIKPLVGEGKKENAAQLIFLRKVKILVLVLTVQIGNWPFIFFIQRHFLPSFAWSPSNFGKNSSYG